MYYPQPNRGGVIAPPPPQGQGFGQGLKQYIDTMRGEKQRKKQEAKSSFFEHLALLNQGLGQGVDLKKMAKWAREAGFAFDYETPAVAPEVSGGASQPALNYGAQQAVGGSVAPPPPQGGARGVVNRLGSAMGVPPPPSQAQQMGALKMLQDVQRSGQQNRQMQEMQQGVQRRGLELLTALDKGLGAGKNFDDPEMVRILGQLQMIGGMGKPGGGLGTLLDNAMAEQMAPNVIKGLREQKAAALKAERNEKVISAWGEKHPEVPPQAVIDAMDGNFGAINEALGEAKGKKLAESLMSIIEKYPKADMGAARAFALLVDAGASLDQIAPALEALGQSADQQKADFERRRVEASEKNAKTSALNASVAQQRLNLDKDEAGDAERIATAVGEAVKSKQGDFDAAWEDLMNKLSGADLLQAGRVLNAVRKKTGATYNINLGPQGE